MKHSRRHGVKARMHIEDSIIDDIAKFMTNYFGTVLFFFINALFFLLWILINLGILPLLPVFDPYPFGLLTMIVSLEAIFLSIIVLISQNRAGQLAEVREEIDFEVDIQSEREITKILQMLDEIHKNLGIRQHNKDKELHSMEKKFDINEIGEELMKE